MASGEWWAVPPTRAATCHSPFAPRGSLQCVQPLARYECFASILCYGTGRWCAIIGRLGETLGRGSGHGWCPHFCCRCFRYPGRVVPRVHGLLIYEFRDDWLTMAVAHSHLFFFFPVLGILALFAFYLPSVVFTHLYWTTSALRQTPLPHRLLVVVAAGSYGFAAVLDKPPRAIWEVSPTALADDKGDAGQGAPHPRRTADLRKEGTEPLRHLELRAQLCARSPLEVPDEFQKERYCFPAEGYAQG